MASIGVGKIKGTKGKPTLRKKEKTSLDIDFDRSAGEQSFGNYDLKTASDITFAPTRRGHFRTTSATSQYSGNGSFVHPFQQTPRPHTPTTSHEYPPSLSDREHSRDSVPLAEDDDEVDEIRSNISIRNLRSNSTFSNLTASYTPRASTDLSPLRIPTKSLSSSRLTHGTSMSNLQSVFSTVSSGDLASPTESFTPTSTFRSSMDKGFRIRAHSHADDGVRYADVHEAREAWRAREKAKEEKFALEQARIEERRAKRAEKAGRKSNASEGIHSKRTKSDSTVTQEKPNGLWETQYDITNQASQADLETYEEEPYFPPKNEMSAKKKTQSKWMSFLIWLRTRILRMKKH